MSTLYTTCVGSSPEDLDASVQELLDAGYTLIGCIAVTSSVEVTSTTTYKYVQALRKTVTETTEEAHHE